MAVVWALTRFPLSQFSNGFSIVRLGAWTQIFEKLFKSSVGEPIELQVRRNFKQFSMKQMNLGFWHQVIPKR